MLEVRWSGRCSDRWPTRTAACKTQWNTHRSRVRLRAVGLNAPLNRPGNSLNTPDKANTTSAPPVAEQPEPEQRWLRAQQYRLIVDENEERAFVQIDLRGCITAWNAGAVLIFHYTAQEVLGQPAAILFTPEDRELGEPEKELALAREKGRAQSERWHQQKNGALLWASGSLRAVNDEQGRLCGYLKIIQDLTHRRVLEEQLQESRHQFELFTESVTDYALVRVDVNGVICSWNSGAQRTFGYSEDEIVGLSMERLATAEDQVSGFSRLHLQKASLEGRAEETRWLVRKNGQRFWARWVTTPIRTGSGGLYGFAKVLRDETERRNAEDRLRASLAEREVLLQEIHHRVKNNLQVIISLLNLQGGQVSDPQVQSMFAETENRVRAIAGIHEMLYSSSDLASIDFGAYLQQLVHDLLNFYSAVRHRVHLRMDVEDVIVDIRQAIPLGLILNELVTNCLKHAFQAGQSGCISVRLRYVRGNADGDAHGTEVGAELSVSDDGKGLPDGFHPELSKGMGARLVQILVRQLHGRLAFQSGKGTNFCIAFPVTPP